MTPNTVIPLNFSKLESLRAIGTQPPSQVEPVMLTALEIKVLSLQFPAADVEESIKMQAFNEKSMLLLCADKTKHKKRH